MRGILFFYFASSEPLTHMNLTFVPSVVFYQHDQFLDKLQPYFVKHCGIMVIQQQNVETTYGRSNLLHPKFNERLQQAYWPKKAKKKKKQQQQQGRGRILTPYNFLVVFWRSYSMRNRRRLSRDFVKSSPRVQRPTIPGFFSAPDRDRETLLTFF